jgi:hypothetical protein
LKLEINLPVRPAVRRLTTHVRVKFEAWAVIFTTTLNQCCVRTVRSKANSK